MSGEVFMSYSGALNDCAMECAMRRIRGRCTKEFGCYECNDCDQYINTYLPVDTPREYVQLFMVQAERSAKSLHYSTPKIGFPPVWVWIILFVAASFGIRECNSYYNTARYLKQVAPVPASVASAGSTRTVYSGIETTLRLVAQRYNAKVDVNGDGLTNCIDAAVLFYQLYPSRDDVRIVLNVNSSTDMNHLFNAVRINGIWLTVEPQAYVNGVKPYWMSDVWGARYNPSRDRIVTNDYRKFVD